MAVDNEVSVARILGVDLACMFIYGLAALALGFAWSCLRVIPSKLPPTSYDDWNVWHYLHVASSRTQLIT